MTDVIVIFGSHSDDFVYGPIMENLKKSGVKVELRISSAHRTPKELEEIVKKSGAKVVIAGAGLSAALPGIVAAHSLKPVIGVPVSHAYAGLDAYLSIAQMPPGIPVMAVGPDNAEEAARNAALMLKEFNGVEIIQRSSDLELLERSNAAKEILGNFKINFDAVYEAGYKDENKIYLDFVQLNEIKNVDPGNHFVIYVPVIKQKDSKVEEVLHVLEMSKKGLWVGLDRGKNAALSAVQILNINGKYTRALEKYREKTREKVFKMDKEENRKWR